MSFLPELSTIVPQVDEIWKACQAAREALSKPAAKRGTKRERPVKRKWKKECFILLRAAQGRRMPLNDLKEKVLAIFSVAGGKSDDLDAKFDAKIKKNPRIVVEDGMARMIPKGKA